MRRTPVSSAAISCGGQRGSHVGRTAGRRVRGVPLLSGGGQWFPAAVTRDPVAAALLAAVLRSTVPAALQLAGLSCRNSWTQGELFPAVIHFRCHLLAPQCGHPGCGVGCEYLPATFPPQAAGAAAFPLRQAQALPGRAADGRVEFTGNWPELQKGKFMSLNHHIPGGAARPMPQEPTEADVLEIYPGASTARRVNPRSRRSLMASEAGMATAEYAIATLAAVGFAGLLVFILRSDEVRGFLLNLIRTALALP